jgi:hypothetical protein
VPPHTQSTLTRTTPLSDARYECWKAAVRYENGFSVNSKTAEGVFSHDIACRVQIRPTSGYIQVKCLKGITLDNDKLCNYMSLNDTPDWIKERVYALSVLEPDENHVIADVGARTSEETFWVFKNERR